MLAPYHTVYLISTASGYHAVAAKVLHHFLPNRGVLEYRNNDTLTGTSEKFADKWIRDPKACSSLKLVDLDYGMVIK
jgi:hypothetical protein